MTTSISFSWTRSRNIIVASFMVAIILMAALTALSESSSAALAPKVVRGYVKDNAGHPVAGANITVNIRYGPPPTGTIRSTLYDTSKSDGFYSTNFSNFQWDVGNIIEVISTWHGAQENNYTSADAKPVQYVNVTYPYAIDEYGSGALGLLIAGGFVGAVAVVLLVRRKPQKKLG